MKTLYIISVILFCSLLAYSQTESKLGTECNPKLNSEEIQFFKTTLQLDTFNLSNKNIGFATNDGFKTWGFDNSFLPISKKKYFELVLNDTKQKFKSKLIILDSFQKQKTKGFDAIFLVYDKKYQPKAEKSEFKRIITVFGYRELNYPDNLNFVGNDTSSKLSSQDAVFFNRIFEFQRTSFDFNNKKIAFINTNERINQNKIKTKKIYIDKIKSHLENDFLFPTDYLYILNDKEKIETGGYDAIIIYQCLKCGGRDAVEILKNGT